MASVIRNFVNYDYPNLELMFDLDTVLTGADDFALQSDQNTASKSAQVVVVAALPTVVIAADDLCAVCMEDFRPNESGKRVHCGHVYHENCISSWLSVGDSCPLCRGHISGENAEAPKNLQ